MNGKKDKTAAFKIAKTTALALAISFFGAAGLVCFFIWLSIVSFHEVSKNPVSYPFSIAGGAVALLCFIISVVFYIKIRKTNISGRGIFIDILTIAVTLPIFFLICAMIYELA
ncbi:MAG TPA: hypothetical protein DEQ65_01735 [Ruminococcaceae bacterium]|nr:hypothetical protein [Oscillospiraceae bacterium]